MLASLAFGYADRFYESSQERPVGRIRRIQLLRRVLLLLAALCIFTGMASADMLLPVGYVSYDVTGPPNSAQFDITNNTGANSTPFPDPTWPVATLVHFLNLNLTVTLENGSTFSCPGASCPTNPYFSLANDNQSFNGVAFTIGSGNEPVKAVLGGTFDTTVVALNDGTTWDISPNAFFDVSGLTSPTITDPAGSCQDSTTGCLNDGDLAVIYAEAHQTTVPEPHPIALLGIACLTLAMVLRRHHGDGRRRLFSRRGIGPVAGLAVCFLLTASDSRAATVKLNTSTTPSTGVAGTTNVNLTVSGMPTGTVDPSGVVITLSTICGGTPSGTTNAISVKQIIGTSDRMNFQIPGAISATGDYFVSVTGIAGSTTFSSGGSCSEIAVTAASNSLVVTNLNDSGPGSLREAIAAANNGDNITFANGLTGPIKLTSGELPIAHSVNVDGPSANVIIVSGNKSSRVFSIAGGLDVNISDLTISGGNGSNEGGGIFNNGSTLTITRVVIGQNVATGGPTGSAEGGGIYSTGGTLTIVGSQLTGNQALGPGGAFGGGIANSGGTLTLTNSTLSGNLAQGGNATLGGNGEGGGIFNSQLGVTKISNSVITQNQATGGGGGDGLGGGIFNDGISTLTLTASFVTLNEAIGTPGVGGGIYNLGTLSFDSATLVANNQASTSGDNIGP